MLFRSGEVSFPHAFPGLAPLWISDPWIFLRRGPRSSWNALKQSGHPYLPDLLRDERSSPQLPQTISPVVDGAISGPGWLGPWPGRSPQRKLSMGNSKDISGIRPSFAICSAHWRQRWNSAISLPFCCLMWTSASLAPHLSHFMAARPIPEPGCATTA